MLNIGGWEMFLILFAALLLLGPQKLPEFARWIGGVLREVRQTTQEVRSAIDFEMEKAELEKLKQQFQNEIDEGVSDFQESLDAQIGHELQDAVAEVKDFTSQPLSTQETQESKEPTSS